ncbi:MAG: hypothetical protein J6D37_01775 [Clostridia bacterium]|nr:hypothetical protein [Clostridia bacterium]
MIKNNLKGIPAFLNAIALVLGIVGVISYFLSGTDASGMTETTVSAMVYVPFLLAVLASAGALLTGNSMVKILAFACYFLTLATFIMTQAGYIVNVFMGIDGNSFSFAYILAVLGIVCPMVLSLVSLKRFRKK